LSGATYYYLLILKINEMSETTTKPETAKVKLTDAEVKELQRFIDNALGKGDDLPNFGCLSGVDVGRYVGTFVMNGNLPKKEERIITAANGTKGRLSMLCMNLSDDADGKEYPEEWVTFDRSFAPLLIDPSMYNKEFYIQASKATSGAGNEYIRLTISN
jgi:hypothetical protein